MKEPLSTRDVQCPTCHAKAGAPCSKPTNSGGRPILGDHSARFGALTDARVTWEKWRRWHDGITPKPESLQGGGLRSW